MSFLRKISNSRKLLIFLTFVVVMGFFLVPQIMGAADEATVTLDRESGDAPFEWIASILIGICEVFISIVGTLLMMFINILLGIAAFNDFVGARAVEIGWVLVRDIANMFFIIIILLIAFGTLFNIETYQYKKLLPKLVVAAVMVNFSKMIVGVFIDLGQVVMMTFVNSFKDIAAGGLINSLGVESMLQLKETIEGIGVEDKEINMWSLAGAVFLALVMLIIALVTVLSLIIVLLARVIMVWILVIFSPFAFIASAMPNGPLDKVGMFGQYWSYLTKYIIIGPILAFFLWLSFALMMIVDQERQQHIISIHRGLQDDLEARDSTSAAQYASYMASKISSPQNMFDYMTAIALLIGSLMVTQQMGVMGGNFGMQAVGKLKNWGTKAAVWAAKQPVKLADWGDSHMWDATGFSPIRTIKKLRSGLKENRERKKEIRELRGDTRAGDHLKAGGVRGVIMGAGAGRDYAEAFASGGFLNRKGFARLGRMARGAKWKDIEEGEDGIQKDRDEISKLEREKAEGDLERNYVASEEANIKENEEQIKEKEEEVTALHKQEREAYDEWQNEKKRRVKEENESGIVTGETSKEKDLREAWEEKSKEEVPKRRDELLKEIVDHKVRVGRAQKALMDESGTGGKSVRDKAIEKREQDIKLKEKEISRLNNGNLSAGVRQDVSDKQSALLEELKQIDKDIREQKKKGAPDAIIDQLEKKKDKVDLDMKKLDKKMVQDKEADKNVLKENKNKAKDLAKEVKVEKDLLEKFEKGEISSDETIDNRIKELKADIKDKQKEQTKYQAPQTFYADQARRLLVAEEDKKITSDNWEEQLGAIRDALENNDWAKFEANFKAAARRGNENEIMDQLGFLNSYRGTEDGVTPEPMKGQGVEAFRKYYLKGKLGMTDEASMAIMDDVGYIGENIGHWSVARGYGIKGGRRYAKSYADQQEEVYAEMSKRDGREMFRKYNRLGWGGEVPQMDGTREMQLEPYAIRRWLTSYDDIYKHIDGYEFSKSQAEHFTKPVAWAQLNAAKKLLPTKKEQDRYQVVLDSLLKFAAAQSDELKSVVKTSNIRKHIDFASKVN